MTKSLEPVTRIFLVYITILSVIHLQNSNIWVTAVDGVCRSTECENLGRMYQKNINKEVRPCDDFYEYVCHGWGRQNRKPSYEDTWRMEALQERTLNTMRQLLENPKNSRTGSIAKAKAIYGACMKLPYMTKVQTNVLKDMIKRVGNWPMFFIKNKQIPPTVKWWKIDNAYIKLSGESALFDLSVGGSEIRSQHVTPIVQRMFSPYGMLRRTEQWNANSPQREHYKNFLLKVLNTVAPQAVTLFGRSFTKDLNDVLQFRDNLSKIIKDSDKVYEEMMIKEVQQWYNRHAKAKDTTVINWLEVIRQMYKEQRDSYGVPIQPSTIIRIDKGYLMNLALLLSQTPARVIFNHVHLYFVERRIMLTPDMLSELQECYTFENGLLKGFVRHEIPRAYTCILSHSMKDVIRDMYVSETLPQNVKEQIVRLIKDTQELLKEEITNSPWLNQETKSRAVKRIDNMINSIGSPEYFKSPVKSRRNPFELDPLEPELYYVVELNRLFVSASYLQVPMFCRNCPFVIDYGATVSTIGHVIQHAFEPVVPFYVTNSSSFYWGSEMRKELRKRTDCFRDQYNGYRRKYLDKYKMPFKVTLPVTIYEDVSDVVGLKIAYKGYKKMLKKNNGFCATLPGFLGMGCERLFFVAFANTLCDAVSPDGEQILLEGDVHSLPRIRINGAVANMKEFSLAFDCKLGDPMYIKKKCDFWSV